MIIATAGHVDHGKTALIRHITGVDTDRLAEEKRRGLSINLGFAYRELDDHSRMAFIDVPGHERFINTMIAGASGVDAGLLVVAADDGVMPQTREHVEILRILGVTELTTVISKIDRVDEDRTQQVVAEVKDLLGDRFQACFNVSNTTGEGIEQLARHLDERGKKHRQRSATGNFRLPVDRAFTLRGAGLVLTGTVASGAINRGAELHLLPAGRPLRLRSLHVQDHEASTGRAGDRCALNVTGDLDRDMVSRGDLVTSSVRMPVVQRFDANIQLLESAAHSVKHMAPVKLYLGTGCFDARLYLLDFQRARQLRPGESALAQLIVLNPVTCCRGDRFLLRDSGERATLGGGMVLDPYAPRVGKSRSSRRRHLEAMAENTVSEALQALLAVGEKPVNVSSLARAWNLRDEEEEALKKTAPVQYFDYESDCFAVPPVLWSGAEKRLIQSVTQWHRDHPEQPGMRPGDLESGLGNFPVGMFLPVLRQLLRSAQLRLVDSRVCLPGHRATLHTAEDSDWATLKHILQRHGARIPLVSELVNTSGLPKNRVVSLLTWATHNGQALKLNENRYALPPQLVQLASCLLRIVDRGEAVTVVNFKTEIDAGRKLAIEILEHFDSIRFTRRLGDQRTLIDRSAPDAVYANVN